MKKITITLILFQPAGNLTWNMYNN